MFKKRIAVIAIAATMACAGMVYAAGSAISQWNIGSSSRPTFKTLPTTQQCIDKIGYAPVIIDKFANGYTFENAVVTNNSFQDEQGNKVESFKGLSIEYEKDHDEFSLSTVKFHSDLPEHASVITNIDGIPIHYSKYMDKFVPADYEMTEEDKAAEASGELVFSYGSDEISICEIQNLSFDKDGIRYSFTQIDGNATVDDLVKMAEEIIHK